MRYLLASPSVLVLSLAGALASVACGSSSPPVLTTNTGSDAGGPSDAGPSLDAPASSAYPAAHAPLPQVDDNGGGVLAAPKVITVTFPGDTLQAHLEAFGDTVTQSIWWDAVRAGYCDPSGSAACVGPGSLMVGTEGHARLTTPAQTDYTDTQTEGGASSLQDLLKAQVAAKALPAPDANTIYVLYMPATSSVTVDGIVSCASGGFAGYHGSVSITAPGASAVDVPYAVVARCDPMQVGRNLTQEQYVTFTASHEIIEAATNPRSHGVLAKAGYYLTNTNDVVWSVIPGGEVGDLCLDILTAQADQTTENGFTVQRSWSNASAKASHDPCVPVPAGSVYFNAAPKGGNVIQLPVGGSTTVEIDAFSDGPTRDWSLQAIDIATLQQQTAVLTFKLDKTTVNNGDKATLTVTLTSTPLNGGSGRPAFEPFWLVSKQGSGAQATFHSWTVAVIAQ